MTNKEYKPLTTGGNAKAEVKHEYIDRLCYLEDCIKNNKLVFLPCKLRDKFWYIRETYYPYRRFYVAECQVDQFVIDDDGLCVEDRYEQLAHPISTVYFSEEEAKQELERRIENDKS